MHLIFLVMFKQDFAISKAYIYDKDAVYHSPFWELCPEECITTYSSCRFGGWLQQTLYPRLWGHLDSKSHLALSYCLKLLDCVSLWWYKGPFCRLLRYVPMVNPIVSSYGSAELRETGHFCGQFFLSRQALRRLEFAIYVLVKILGSIYWYLDFFTSALSLG